MVTKLNQPARDIIEEMVADASRGLRDGALCLGSQSKL